MRALMVRRPGHPGHLILAAIVWAGIACDSETPGPAHAPLDAPRGSERIEVRDPQAPAPIPGVAATDTGYLKEYRFNEDWFSHNIVHWSPLLEPYKGRAGVRYLEVGLWEGRSFLWMLDHVLTHPSSRATGIDIQILDTLRDNLALAGAADRVTIIEGSSQVELRKLPFASYEIVYIDGSHTADDVLEDMVLSWRLLEPGGLMILDDYAWRGSRDPQDESLPDELLPRIAIDAFISANRNFVEVVLEGYQVVLRKRSVGCPRGKSQCSSLGAYSYDWRDHTLHRNGRSVALSESERDIVEALIRSRRGDGLTLDLAPELYDSEELSALDSHLGLGLR